MTDENMLVPPAVRDRMLAMIGDYQRRVGRFVQAAKAFLGEEDLLAASLAGRLPEEGRLDDAQGSAFCFHGTGCEVRTVDAEVDFDFGPEGRHDGFDAWRLHTFAESRPQAYPEFQDMAVIERALEELQNSDVIFSPRWLPSPHLLYFGSPSRWRRAL
ncbi:MAG: hypothetical protein R6X20_07360 [Phycisphaerae bacterium]